MKKSSVLYRMLALTFTISMTISVSAQAKTSVTDFFIITQDSNEKLPDNLIYPRGQIFPISLFSIGGVSGKIDPGIQQALKQVKKDGFTMIGPQYELNDRSLKD